MLIFRTLQMISSWISREKVPNLDEIQEILVKIEDKNPAFLHSRDWIGSFEVRFINN